MEENKNPLMGHVVKVPAQVSGIPDGEYACQLYAGNGLVLCPRGKARYGERPSG